MKSNAKIIFCVLHTLLFVGLCQAKSEHEMFVGAQKEQICNTSTIEVVGRFLNIKEFKVPPDGYSPNEEAIIAAAACKPHPANKQITIAAIAYDTKKSETKALIIALLDNIKGNVIASYSREYENDSFFNVESGSLWIDTTLYNLTNDVRAFGLDVTSGYIPHCVDGGFGSIRTLYVQEGKMIRPILESLTMSEWTFIQEGQSRCNQIAAPDEETIIENFDLSISVSKTTTNGYKDLLITAINSRDDGKKAKRKPFHFKLSYDGKKYPTEAMQKAYEKWSN